MLYLLDANVVKEALRLREEADPELVSRDVYTGYADDISDVEIEKLGRIHSSSPTHWPTQNDVS